MDLSKGLKKCSRCKLILPLSSYYLERTKGDGEVKAVCKQCSKTIMRERGSSGYFAEYMKRYRSSEKYKAKARARRKKQREELHPEYMKRLLVRYLPMGQDEVPQEAIEVKRAIVEIKRAIK